MATITKTELLDKIETELGQLNRAQVESALTYYEQAGLTEQEQVDRFCKIATSVAKRLGIS